METEELIQKYQEEIHKNMRMSEGLPLKIVSSSELNSNFERFSQKKIKKSDIYDSLRKYERVENNRFELDKNENENILNLSKISEKVKTNKKTKEDLQYEDLQEILVHFEKFVGYQEQFHNEVLNQRNTLINEQNKMIKYTKDADQKIININSEIEINRINTEKEIKRLDEMYNLMIEEKKNLEDKYKNEEILEKNLNEILNSKLGKLEIINESNLELSLKIQNETINFEEKKKQSEEISKEIQDLSALNIQLSQNLKENLDKKKYLNNELQELKGNIRVYCRIRPFLESDPIQEKDKNLFSIGGNNTLLTLNIPSKMMRSENNAKDYKFYFEQIFSETSTQQDIFNELSQLIQSALDGYNVCIFAYGQTGSGKTYTMEGFDNEENIGIIPRGVEFIFHQISYLKKYGWEYKVLVSFQEIYMDQIRDLLKDTVANNGEVSLINVDSPQDLNPLLKIANQNRKVAETFCNERSSRSHSIFQLKLIGKNMTNNQEVKGTLNLIDLAGSERLSISKAEGDRLKETQSINKSLTALGDVITALANKEKHIPYRNSKLTFCLQNYLGGDSKTLMFVNVSPYISNVNQTLCSLRFADKVKKCKIGVAKKHTNNF